jgi:hypothetical protein
MIIKKYVQDKIRFGMPGVDPEERDEALSDVLSEDFAPCGVESILQN